MDLCRGKRKRSFESNDRAKATPNSIPAVHDSLAINVFVIYRVTGVSPPSRILLFNSGECIFTVFFKWKERRDDLFPLYVVILLPVFWMAFHYWSHYGETIHYW